MLLLDWIVYCPNKTIGILINIQPNGCSYETIKKHTALPLILNQIKVLVNFSVICANDYMGFGIFDINLISQYVNCVLSCDNIITTQNFDRENECIQDILKLEDYISFVLYKILKVGCFLKFNLI